MCDKEFKELVKITVEKLKDESVLKLLQADAHRSNRFFGSILGIGISPGVWQPHIHPCAYVSPIYRLGRHHHQW